MRRPLLPRNQVILTLAFDAHGKSLTAPIAHHPTTETLSFNQRELTEIGMPSLAVMHPSTIGHTQLSYTPSTYLRLSAICSSEEILDVSMSCSNIQSRSHSQFPPTSYPRSNDHSMLVTGLNGVRSQDLTVRTPLQAVRESPTFVSLTPSEGQPYSHCARPSRHGASIGCAEHYPQDEISRASRVLPRPVPSVRQTPSLLDQYLPHGPSAPLPRLW